MARIGPVISFIARIVASRTGRPFASQCSMFSSTTMASSTTMPIASTSPNRVRSFSERPMSFITANVPTSDSASLSGVICHRSIPKECKKRFRNDIESIFPSSPPPAHSALCLFAPTRPRGCLVASVSDRSYSSAAPSPSPRYPAKRREINSDQSK